MAGTVDCAGLWGTRPSSRPTAYRRSVFTGPSRGVTGRSRAPPILFRSGSGVQACTPAWQRRAGTLSVTRASRREDQAGSWSPAHKAVQDEYEDKDLGASPRRTLLVTFTCDKCGKTHLAMAWCTLRPLVLNVHTMPF